MDTPYVRQYVEDREITAWFLLDLSPSVDFGTADEAQKRTVLIDFVTTLARLLTRHGNRVGAMFFTGQVERTIPAAAGACRCCGWSTTCSSSRSCPRRRSPTWRRCFRAALHDDQTALAGVRHLRLHQRAGWERPLDLLNQRHEVLAVRLWDPREVELPDVGLDHYGRCRDGRAAVRRHARQSSASASRRRRSSARPTLADAFKRAGVDALPLSTDDDLVRAIVRFATLRAAAERSNSEC